MSTSPPVHQSTGLSPDEDLRYHVVDNQVVELTPMGAYEVWLATSLVARLETFARQHQLGRAVQEMLFDLTAATRRKRRPDVAFVSFDRWPRHRRIPRTEAWEVVPNLAVEVVSRMDSFEHLVDKGADYFQPVSKASGSSSPPKRRSISMIRPPVCAFWLGRTNCLAIRFCCTSDCPWLSCLRMPNQLRSHILPPLHPRGRLPHKPRRNFHGHRRFS